MNRNGKRFWCTLDNINCFDKIGIFCHSEMDELSWCRSRAIECLKADTVFCNCKIKKWIWFPNFIVSYTVRDILEKFKNQWTFCNHLQPFVVYFKYNICSNESLTVPIITGSTARATNSIKTSTYELWMLNNSSTTRFPESENESNDRKNDALSKLLTCKISFCEMLFEWILNYFEWSPPFITQFIFAVAVQFLLLTCLLKNIDTRAWNSKNESNNLKKLPLSIRSIWKPWIQIRYFI